MEKLEMQDLEKISGGVSYDNAGRPMSQDVCPFCGFPGLIQTIDWDSPNHMEVLLCPDCYNAYYRNAAGVLVHHRRIMG